MPIPVRVNSNHGHDRLVTHTFSRSRSPVARPGPSCYAHTGSSYSVAFKLSSDLPSRDSKPNAITCFHIVVWSRYFVPRSVAPDACQASVFDELGRPARPVFRSKFSSVIVFTKSQNVVTLQSNEKRPGHKQIMEIQRPEMASNTNSPVKKEARRTVSSEQIHRQEQL